MTRKRIFFNTEEVIDIMFELGLTQRALADAIGITEGSISGLLRQRNKTAMGPKLYGKFRDFFVERIKSPSRVELCFYRK